MSYILGSASKYILCLPYARTTGNFQEIQRNYSDFHHQPMIPNWAIFILAKMEYVHGFNFYRSKNLYLHRQQPNSCWCKTSFRMSCCIKEGGQHLFIVGCTFLKAVISRATGALQSKLFACQELIIIHLHFGHGLYERIQRTEHWLLNNASRSTKNGSFNKADVSSWSNLLAMGEEACLCQPDRAVLIPVSSHHSSPLSYYSALTFISV